MKVAIDKNIIDKIKDLDEFEYIYVFENSEDIDDLIKTNLHCINKDYIEYVDVNLTDYNIDALKQTKITDKNWKEQPKKKDYRYCIIIPNYNNNHGDYNGKTFLQNCIESVLNQTYKNFELVFVDDMSTDKSVENVDNYVDNRIHIIKNRRKRYNGGSRNVGIEYALDNLDFDYFCFLDSDDWWKDENVLQTINNSLYEHEMLLFGLECIDKNGVFLTKTHQWDNYEDFFLSNNKVWCTAWSRVIRKDKIVYFCEDTLMEDRVWSYRQADNVDLNKVKNLKKILYVWNRLNTSNSVSLTRSDYWNASAWCHIGHQKQLLTELKHIEMKPILEKRINECIGKVNRNKFEQY